VRQLRRAADLTIEALAGAAEIDPNYLGQVERGAQNPSINVLARIASGLNADLTTLVDIHSAEDAVGLRRIIAKRCNRLEREQLRLVLRLLDAIRL
jgi:transcriptional regulator with XRE-family HTH domain